MEYTKQINMNHYLTDFIELKPKSTPIAMVAPELKQSVEDTGITRTCAVLGCDDSKHLESEVFFRFPEDPNLRQLWTSLTGRNNWTPTDYSYVCVQHFSVECFKCDDENTMVLVDGSVPSLKLPKHVLEVEYIDDDITDNEENYEESEAEYKPTSLTNGGSSGPRLALEHLPKQPDNQKLLETFTQVQRIQRDIVVLKDKLKYQSKLYKKRVKQIDRLKHMIELKQKVINQKKKRKARILLSIEDRLKEDTNGLVLAMPSRYTEDLKNFALSIYKYSPQAYIYVRNTLRTMLPSTDILESWIEDGFKPSNVIADSDIVKVIAEQTDKELSCKVTLS